MSRAELADAMYIQYEPYEEGSGHQDKIPPFVAGFGFIPVEELPIDYAIFEERGWDTAYFEANNHTDDYSLVNTLVLSMQLYETRPKPMLGALDSDMQAKVEKAVDQASLVRTNEDGESAGPVFLTRMRQGRIRSLVSPLGTDGWGFSDLTGTTFTTPRSTIKGGSWVPQKQGLLIPEELAAMGSLYRTASAMSRKLISSEFDTASNT